MVKGTTRQVIVVRPQETDVFEQAIFLLREAALEQHARAAASRLSCTPRWARHLWGWRGSPAC